MLRSLGMTYRSMLPAQIQTVAQLHCIKKFAIDTTSLKRAEPDSLEQMIRSAAFTEYLPFSFQPSICCLILN